VMYRQTVRFVTSWSLVVRTWPEGELCPEIPAQELTIQFLATVPGRQIRGSHRGGSQRLARSGPRMLRMRYRDGTRSQAACSGWSQSYWTLSVSWTSKFQQTEIALMTDALNACTISAGIAICTFMIPFTHARGAPNRWLSMGCFRQQSRLSICCITH